MVHGKLEAEQERDQDILEDSIIVLRFLSESYMKQWKIRYAQHRYTLWSDPSVGQRCSGSMG